MRKIVIFDLEEGRLDDSPEEEARKQRGLKRILEELKTGHRKQKIRQTRKRGIEREENWLNKEGR